MEINWTLTAVALIGTAIAALSIWGFAAPDKLIAWMFDLLRSAGGIWIAVGARFLIGAILIFAAPLSKTPAALTILGWVTLAAGVAILLIGRKRLLHLATSWAARFSADARRAWMIVGIGFGAFLVWASV